MKPAPFDYQLPRDLPDALLLLADAKPSTKIIAGGQSLGPMLNLRLVEPELLVDISALDELKRVEHRGDELLLGACITHADIEDGRVPDVTRGAMQEVAADIAYRAVRNRGTLGGSLGHADPAADWLSALAALGAKLTLRSSATTRLIGMESFLVAALESALRPGEIIETIHVPAMPESARWGYFKSCRKVGEYADAIGAVLIDPSAGMARLVIGATGSAPIVINDTAELFGGRIAADYNERFDARVADATLAKAGVANAAQRLIHINVLKRAIRKAAA